MCKLLHCSKNSDWHIVSVQQMLIVINKNILSTYYKHVLGFVQPLWPNPLTKDSIYYLGQYLLLHIVFIT